MNSFYVYAYLDPRKPGKFKYGEYEFTHEPFYIGKGTKSRINRHLAGNGGFNTIEKNFGKYLRLMDKKITDGDKTYCNLLHVVSVNKNSKVNNIFNLLDSNKIYKFYELHTI